MKTIIGTLVLILCSLAHAATPVELHGALKVQGNKIVGSHGETVAMAGNSLFWSNDSWGGEAFYNRNVIEYLDEEWDTSIIRVAMGVEDYGGYIGSPSNNLQKAKTIIDLAIEKGLYVIVDWHSHNAEDYQSQAIAFFTQIAQEYGDQPNIIYEVYNEPIHQDWNNEIKPYAEAVIQAIRAEGSDNLVIVGTSTWSQDVDVASNNPITMDDNIAYTIHFYAGTHFESLRNKARTALNNGIALFCTEWGAVNADGNGGVNEDNTRAWMSFLRENDISHCNWAVNNKAEGASIFLPGTSPTANFTDANLTPSGTLVKEIVLDWALDDEPDNPRTDFVPDTSKLYHIENPAHGLRLAATGNSEDAYTTSLSVNSADTRWKFVQSSTNGLWHIERAAGGTKPRLRTDLTVNPDMQPASSEGINTQFSITESPIAGTYLFTVPNANTNLQRFRILSNGGIDFATNSNEGSNPSLRIVEASAQKIVRIEKRNAQSYALHCNESANGGNVNLHSNQTHSNLQWVEIDRGNGFCSYQRANSTHSIDGGNGGANNQNVQVWTTNSNNYNQHWQKVSTGGGAYQLRKRNATGFCINGGGSGANFQNVTLWNASSTSQNLQWFVAEQ